MGLSARAALWVQHRERVAVLVEPLKLLHVLHRCVPAPARKLHRRDDESEPAPQQCTCSVQACPGQNVAAARRTTSSISPAAWSLPPPCRGHLSSRPMVPGWRRARPRPRKTSAPAARQTWSPCGRSTCASPSVCPLRAQHRRSRAEHNPSRSRSRTGDGRV